MNDFDDEHTLDEEEALGAEDSKQEIDELHKASLTGSVVRFH